MSSPAARIAAARAVGLGPNSNWAQINHAKDGRGHRAAAPVSSTPAAPAAPAISLPKIAAPAAPAPPPSPSATEIGQSGEDTRKKNRGFGYRASLLSNPDATEQIKSANSARSLLGASEAGTNTATGRRSLLGL